MKRKFLSVISIVLVLCQLLPVYAGAVDTLDVFPIIYMFPSLDVQSDSNNDHLSTYQTTNESTTFHFKQNSYYVTPDHSTDFEHGVLFPINNITNIEGGFETYLVNFTMQIKPLKVEPGTFLPDELSPDLLSLFINYGSSGELQSFPVASSTGVYSYESNGVRAYYKCIYTPYLDEDDDNDTWDEDDLYYGVYTLHFTLLLKLNYNSTLQNVFFNLDFYNLCSCYEEIDFIIQPCQTVSYVVSDLDDIDSELNAANTLLTDIYGLLEQLNNNTGLSGGQTTRVLANILNNDKAGYADLKKASEDIRSQVQDMQDTMDEKVDEGMQSFKDKVEKEANEKVDKTVQEILDKVDIVDTGAAENAFTALYNALTTESMDAQLTVPDFNIDIGDDSYSLWKSFTIDIPDLLDQMGIDDFMIIVRFPFYFGFGWFLYGKVNRLIKIMLLDDVNEDQPT